MLLAHQKDTQMISPHVRMEHSGWWGVAWGETEDGVESSGLSVGLFPEKPEQYPSYRERSDVQLTDVGLASVGSG
jgi:hypothetical protein